MQLPEPVQQVHHRTVEKTSLGFRPFVFRWLCSARLA